MEVKNAIFFPSDSDRIESTGAFHTSEALACPQFESFSLSQRSEKCKLHERTEKKNQTIKSHGMKARTKLLYVDIYG